MFQCKQCGSQEFDLQVQASFQGDIHIETNDAGDVVIHAGGAQFVADLMFMNRFGVCRGCGAKKQWDYYFEEAHS